MSLDTENGYLGAIQQVKHLKRFPHSAVRASARTGETIFVSKIIQTARKKCEVAKFALINGADCSYIYLNYRICKNRERV